MKIKIISHMVVRGSFLNSDYIEESLNEQIEAWMKQSPRKNPRIINSTVTTNASGDIVYQVHIAHD